MKNCPTCERRPSERNGIVGDIKRGGERIARFSETCLDPIHDRADACEEMYGALEVVQTVLGSGFDGPDHEDAARASIDAALKLARGAP